MDLASSLCVRRQHTVSGLGFSPRPQKPPPHHSTTTNQNHSHASLLLSAEAELQAQKLISVKTKMNKEDKEAQNCLIRWRQWDGTLRRCYNCHRCVEIKKFKNSAEDQEFNVFEFNSIKIQRIVICRNIYKPVSYTHLTLPTILRV